MLHADMLRTVQIRNGPGHPQYPVVAPGGETHPLKGGLHQRVAPGIQLAEPAHHRGRHLGVAGDTGALKPLGLNGAGGVHPFLDLSGGFRLRLSPHGLVFHGGDIYMEVDPAQQRTGDLLDVLLHFFVRAGAFPGGMATPATLAGIHGAHQLELGGEPQGTACPCHGDDTILQGLTEGFQYVPVKFRQLVQKQHARQTRGSITIIETLPPLNAKNNHIAKAIPTGYSVPPWGRGYHPISPHQYAMGRLSFSKNKIGIRDEKNSLICQKNG